MAYADNAPSLTFKPCIALGIVAPIRLNAVKVTIAFERNMKVREGEVHVITPDLMLEIIGDAQGNKCGFDACFPWGAVS